MPCNNCAAPESVTNIYSAAASIPLKENFVLGIGLTVTLSELPVDGGVILLTVDGVPQVEDTNYTVDELTGIITMIGAVAGQAIQVVYIAA